MRDEKIMRIISERVLQFLQEQAEGKTKKDSWMVMCRKLRLETGKGRSSAEKILLEDYDMVINEFGEAEKRE